MQSRHMKINMLNTIVLTALGVASCSHDGTISIDMDNKGAEVPESMYGIFFEEINHAGDGGIYAELIRNRGFEDSSVPEGFEVRDGSLYPVSDACNHITGTATHLDMAFRWDTSEIPAWTWVQTEGDGADVSLTKEYPMNDASPTAVKITIPASGTVTLSTRGYWGMNLQEGQKSYLRRNTAFGDMFSGTAHIRLVGKDGSVLCDRPLNVDTDRGWCEYTGELVSTGTDPYAHLEINFKGVGTILLDYVSLFPVETFRNHPNGLRKDIARTIEAMKPAFIRWPGGCIVEGITLSNRIRWKETIGDPKSRPGNYVTWGYRATMGFGYHEFLQFCEDIGADAMFVCNAGMGCQGRAGDICQDDELEFFIDDALDAIDYALGDGTTEWSRMRVENGHPEPFPLKYVEIGNENWGPVYEKRYDIFYKAIKARYPDLILISTLGLGGQKRHEKVDMIDPHWYVAPEFFFGASRLFDTQDRGDYKIYVGEYAVNQNVEGGNLYGALAEAAFLTGIERNSDLVTMTSYAPLFENVNDRVWPVNMIWFDSHRVMGRSSYHVQKMYAENRPDYNVGVDFRQPEVKSVIKGQIGLGGWNTDNEFRDLKVTLADGTVIKPNMGEGWAHQEGTWTGTADILRQTGPGVMRWSRWTAPEAIGDCTIEVKAQKNAGEEGFLIFFGMKDELKGYVLNIGGWGNQSSSFQEIKGTYMPQIPGYIAQRIETGRWYDIKIEICGNRLTYWLDGTRCLETAVNEVKRYAVAGYDEKASELVVKFVNATGEPYHASVDISSAGKVHRKGTVFTLTSGSPEDENTLDNPKKVYPVKSVCRHFGEKFSYTFEPWSFTVLRIKADKKQ